ncbi:glycosyltransferase [Candidatus Nucleicultrix amoebiphila]|jgi:glycosyltransferase involved in cell wall biosynthesis|uniref:Glycosyl transferase family 1 domain-containing protein n=1 Tax=Candidatus Nucleicultrix amoebiphila FS5 TaxID=1414854 RepID=A0A1W6N5J1_9PROT|nr:glycosyltransferase [Candidatus Nucleicultrix amoebiphila]ARN85113.1 hypothetical protein GQ61_07220 [Candidatus Nucleicultrix amoebiphila FS5]
MRVLQVMAGAEVGGAEVFFGRLIQALHADGLSQQVLMRAHAERMELFDQAKIPYTIAPFKPLFDLKTRRLFKEAIKEFRPDIVMTWMSRASHLCPQGSFVHVARLGGYYDLKYYKKADYLIGNTQDIFNYFLGKGWNKDYAVYLPNFVPEPDTTKSMPRSAFNTPDDVPLLLSLGRFHDDKAFDVLIKALKYLDNTYLWLAGEGEREGFLKNLAEKQGVLERIRFIGWQRSVTPLFNAADLYVCPSRIEPLGNVVIEAWSHKSPIVAAASAGPAGLIENRKNGLLVPVEDDGALATAIQEVIQNKTLRSTIIKGGAETFKEKFSKEIVTQKYREFFARVIDKKRV